MKTSKELHNDNLKAQKRLLSKKELSPAELKVLEAYESAISEYEDRNLSRDSLRIVK